MNSDNYSVQYYIGLKSSYENQLDINYSRISKLQNELDIVSTTITKLDDTIRFIGEIITSALGKFNYEGYWYGGKYDETCALINDDIRLAQDAYVTDLSNARRELETKQKNIETELDKLGYDNASIYDNISLCAYRIQCIINEEM